jgi:hypothetical protein
LELPFRLFPALEHELPIDGFMRLYNIAAQFSAKWRLYAKICELVAHICAHFYSLFGVCRIPENCEYIHCYFTAFPGALSRISGFPA